MAFKCFSPNTCRISNGWKDNLLFWYPKKRLLSSMLSFISYPSFHHGKSRFFLAEDDIECWKSVWSTISLLKTIILLDKTLIYVHILSSVYFLRDTCSSENIFLFPHSCLSSTEKFNFFITTKCILHKFAQVFTSCFRTHLKYSLLQPNACLTWCSHVCSHGFPLIVV